MNNKPKPQPAAHSFNNLGSIFSSLGAVVIVVCAATSCLVLAGMLPAAAGKLGLLRLEPTKVSCIPLTFTERVAYQRAIEEVYWRHRIWPRSRGERPDAKPSLDVVMSQAQLEKKVTDYLR